MHKKILVIGSFLTFLLVGSYRANALMVMDGDPEPTHSITQRFHFNNQGSHSSWDRFEIRILSQYDSFEDGGIFNVGDGWGWSHGSYSLTASGPDREDDLSCAFTVNGNLSDWTDDHRLIIETCQFGDDRELDEERGRFEFDGDRWHCGNPPKAVPEPATILLLGAGLFIVGTFRKGATD